MTEKRFTLTESFSCLLNVTFVCKDNINYMTVDETIDLLNSLSEENEQLKSDLEYYRETYSIQEYGLDIETHVQLSSPILSRKELLKENEQLKQQSNSVYEIVKEYVMSHHCISTMRMLKKIEKVMWND